MIDGYQYITCITISLVDIGILSVLPYDWWTSVYKLSYRMIGRYRYIKCITIMIGGHRHINCLTI